LLVQSRPRRVSRSAHAERLYPCGKEAAAFLGRSPGEASAEDLRRFQIHLRQTGVPAPPRVNCTISALRFFYRTTLDKPEIVRHLAVVPKAHRLPVVLSSDEVTHLLEAASGPKYKAAFSLAYGAGLRVAEIASVKFRCNCEASGFEIGERFTPGLGALAIAGRESDQLPSCPPTSRRSGRALL
jgi:integrase